MIRTVLLPADIKEQFLAMQSASLEPLYYRLNPESFLNRVCRKLGWMNTARALDLRFDIPGHPDRLARVEAIWLSDKFTLPDFLLKALLDKMPCLRWVYWQRTGTDNLDLDYFSRRNIALSNTGNLVSHSVAEMNLACILSHAKRLPEHHAMQKSHEWRAVYCDAVTNQTAGIIGTGNIGRETARLCKALGMKVVAASRNPARFLDRTHPFDHVYHLNKDMDKLLNESDYIVIAVPLNETTRNLFGSALFRSMRGTAALINTARCEIVNQDELLQALTSNRIAAAYIDPPFNRQLYFWDRIYRTKNLYLTHNSSANYRHKPLDALIKFTQGIEQEDKTGDFPDRVI